jgi:hypothetical protein
MISHPLHRYAKNFRQVLFALACFAFRRKYKRLPTARRILAPVSIQQLRALTEGKFNTGVGAA